MSLSVKVQEKAPQVASNSGTQIRKRSFSFIYSNKMARRMCKKLSCNSAPWLASNEALEIGWLAVLHCTFLKFGFADKKTYIQIFFAKQRRKIIDWELAEVFQVEWGKLAGLVRHISGYDRANML